MSRSTTGVCVAVALLAAASALSAQSAPAPKAYAAGSTGVPVEESAAVRAATEKYRDVNVALAEGYVPHLLCMISEMEGSPRQLGAMGYHYFRPDLLGITAERPRVDGVGLHTDFTRPAILLYEPQADGSLELTAIENLVWAKAWREAGNDGPPEFHGNQYYFRTDNQDTEVDEAHGFEPHFELHWWLYRENPAGEFAQYNTAATCANAPPEHMVEQGGH